MLTANLHATNTDFNQDEQLFADIAADLCQSGFSIHHHALPQNLITPLWQYSQNLAQHNFKKAGIGRKSNFEINNLVRSDAISWIVESGAAQKKWLAWADGLKQSLNRELFLGLNSFESHFSHFAKGDFYKPHFDAFKGTSNRKLSVVVYLNPEWLEKEGGELVLYPNDNSNKAIKVQPTLGTLVVFLSDAILHEVKISSKDRYSIAGWFSSN